MNAEYRKQVELLIETINEVLTEKDKEFLLSFANANPNWEISSFIKLQIYPSIKWKLENLNLLKVRAPQKFKMQIALLKQLLYLSK